MTSEALRERLKALTLEYVKTFDAEADALEVDRSQLEDPDLAVDATERIRRRAHRLAGTAGTYALSDLCAAASLTERAGGTEGVDALIACLRDYEVDA